MPDDDLEISESALVDCTIDVPVWRVLQGVACELLAMSNGDADISQEAIERLRDTVAATVLEVRAIECGK